jgi:hypothetical protein
MDSFPSGGAEISMAASLQEGRPDANERWVPVARYTSLHEAGIAQGLLESAGIASALDNEMMVGMLWHLSNAVGGVRVRVAAADEEAARALLAEGVAAAEVSNVEENAAGEAKAGDDDDDQPIESEREAMVRRALVSALLGFFIPLFLHLWALTLLVQVPFGKGRLDGRHKVRFAVALALTLLGLALCAPLLAVVLRRSR